MKTFHEVLADSVGYLQGYLEYGFISGNMLNLKFMIERFLRQGGYTAKQEVYLQSILDWVSGDDVTPTLENVDAVQKLIDNSASVA